MGSISEFSKKKKDAKYYKTLTSDLAKLNSKLNFLTVVNDKISKGMPFTVKDNICVRGFEATAGSKMLNGYTPPFSATSVSRMEEKGFGFIGKATMDEFGFGSFGINTQVQAKNPFNEKYVAGGSSSGSAVATSLMKYHVAIAESTGGSISNPASFCGVVGFTPTYGLISRYGLIDYANSLDKIGIMARSADDVRETFDIVKGKDKYDTTCVDEKVTSSKRKKLVVIDQLMKGLDPQIESSFGKLLDKLEGKGYKIEHAKVDFIDKAIQAYYIISMAEASTNLAKYVGYKYGLQVPDFTKKYNEFFTTARENFGLEAKRRIVLGTFVRSASVKDKYYVKALKLRTALTNKLSELMKDGFIISPTMPIMAPKIEDAQKLSPLQNYAMDALTIPPNLSGFPHVSFPSDYVGGMPIGTQLTTSHFNDYALLDFVSEWEKSFEYKFKHNLGSI
ncbi:MAG: Asp-tRNA(Asn)/Glu-tRNA(Gln) amidotransferase subunit GatA [Candidatus Micrarchaeota archaeon]|nr:Asp-tRNA(Asn)/Glu-tRNA(Gln) amidotransferase subunit GatA [Candidatus Micrarchaeota archaeon]